MNPSPLNITLLIHWSVVGLLELSEGSASTHSIPIPAPWSSLPSCKRGEAARLRPLASRFPFQPGPAPSIRTLRPRVHVRRPLDHPTVASAWPFSVPNPLVPRRERACFRGSNRASWKAPVPRRVSISPFCIVSKHELGTIPKVYHSLQPCRDRIA